MDPTLMIYDVKEKDTTSPQPPSFPQIKSSTSGFPEHKKRTRISAFKQQRHGKAPQEKNTAAFTTSVEPTAQNPKIEEKQSIERENNEKLASMSTAEIEEARQELFNGLDPKIMEMLLKRANLDEKHGPSPFDEPTPDPPPTIQVEDAAPPAPTTPASRRVHFEEVPEDEDLSLQTTTQAAPDSTTSQINAPSSTRDTTAPPTLPSEHLPTNDLPPSKPHWPATPAPPDIDPSDPNFLASLHEKYFPSLPADPSKLAWMAPLPTVNSPADYDSPYHPSHTSLPISALRFDFRGTLLPPRISRAVPVSKGLHHHGEAPEAAGYTIGELARLARSAVPGQRCIAYQTLGRVLFRLGRGEFGRVGDGVPDGVWAAACEGKVMESLYEEAGMDPDGTGTAGRGRGHRSAHAFAVEAIWLFEKGGWRERLKKGK
ncbi:RPAP1-like protein [Xylariales sp. AK1849]|nr:RPAP1-like protein [Xylariales sp. AK1849]